MTEPDKRLNAYRADVADARLKGRVTAERFSEGRVMQVVEPVISVHKEPRFDAMQVSQVLMGEKIRVFVVENGWAFAQAERDSYVGYVRADQLSLLVNEPTHRVSVPSSFLYTSPNIKTQPAVVITLNAEVTVTVGIEKFATISDGRLIYAPHLKPIGEFDDDFVAVATMFLNTPYYWGGKSATGLDCSGLVQLALEACGTPCPRDTDMQENALGTKRNVSDLDGLRRGDLVFWRGHVGIMTDAQTLLHANGHHMLTVAEPLREAVARIETEITSIKRL